MSYGDYVGQLIYLWYLKMADERPTAVQLAQPDSQQERLAEPVKNDGAVPQQ